MRGYSPLLPTTSNPTILENVTSMTTSPTQLSNPNRRIEITQLDLDRFLVWAYRSTPERAIDAIGLRRVLEAIGIKQVIEAIGIVKIVEYYVEKYGIDGFIALLLENHRQRGSVPAATATIGVLPSPPPRVE